MCVRKENEAYVAFLFRWFKENPQWFVAVIFIATAAAIYVDFREYIHEQEQIQRDNIKVLTELTLRVENIERAVKGGGHGE